MIGTLFIQGILAAIQICVLPGLLLMKVLKIQIRSLIQKTVICFGLSLVANYSIVSLLTMLKLYLRPVIYLIILIEIGLLVWFYRAALQTGIGTWIGHSIAAIRKSLNDWAGRLSSSDDEEGSQPEKALPKGVFLAFAVIGAILSADALWWFFKVFRYNMGDVFRLWDAVVSWNPWATQWATNHIPYSMLYPQLIPANWSLSYILMGNTQIQLFAVGLMPLFPLFTLLLIFDRGVELRSVGYFAGLIISRYMIKKFLGDYITDGYVDTALMFMAFASVFCLLVGSESTDPKRRVQYAWLGGIFAAGAAVIKQGGLFMLAIYPLLAYFMILQETPDYTRKARWSVIGKIMLVALAIVIPWYLIAEYRVAMHQQTSGIQWVTQGIYGGKGLAERFVSAITGLGKYNALYILSFLTLPMLKKSQRILFLAVVLPYTLIWAFYFSYENRNLALVYPILCLTAGLGLEQLVRITNKLILRLKIGKLVKTWHILVLLAIGVILSSHYITNAHLTEIQVSQQKEIIFPDLNQEIYAVLENYPAGTRIISSYPLNLLPGLENTLLFNFFSVPDNYFTALEQNPDIRLILIPKDSHPTIVEPIFENIDNGTYALLFELGRWMMVDIRGE